MAAVGANAGLRTPSRLGTDLFKHLAVRTRWPGGARGLYYDYLKVSCHFEFSRTVLETGKKELFRQLMSCDHCAKVAKCKTKKKPRSVTGRCACHSRPAYFSPRNSGDLQKLSDLVESPLVLRDHKGRVLFDNTVLYILSQGDKEPIAVRVSRLGVCRREKPLPREPEKIIPQLLAELKIPADHPHRLVGPADLFTREGTKALEELTGQFLGGKCLALACRKSRIGPPSSHGWSILGAYGPRSFRDTIVNQAGGTDHLSSTAALDWNGAVVLEITSQGTTKLTGKVSSQIPALCCATERQSGGSTQPSAWREKLESLQEAGRQPPPPERRRLASSPCSTCSLCTEDLEKWSSLSENPEGAQTLHEEPDTVVDLLKLAGLYDEDSASRVAECHRLSIVGMDIESYSKPVTETEGRLLTQVEAMGRRDADDSRPPPEILTRTPLTSENRSLYRQSPVLLASVDGISGLPDFKHLGEWKSKWKDLEDSMQLANGGVEVTPEQGDSAPLSGCGSPAFFFIKDPEDWPSVCKRYLEHELRRHAKAIQAKKDLLSPLLDHLLHLKTHHFLFRLVHYRHLVRLRTEDVPEEDCEQSEIYARQFQKTLNSARLGWRSTHLGKLEAALEKIINQRRILSFNGSSYDMVLLCAPLCLRAPECEIIPGVHNFKMPDYDPSLKCSHSELLSELPEPIARGRGGPAKMKVMRNGGKINQLTVAGTGVTFGDAMKLLPAGTSLAKFVELMGLPVSKGLFPFGRLDSFEFLMEPRLPSDPRQWHSILGGGATPSPEKVQECLRLFDELGCVNNLSYICYYLLMDCALLVAAVLKFDWLFSRFMGTTPMQTQKFTAASFSFAAVCGFLKARRRPGFFRGNNPLVQATGQLAMRGGVTAALATLGGEADPHPINHHLYRAQNGETSESLPGLYAPDPDLQTPDQLTRATRICSYDFHSMYAAGGL